MAAFRADNLRELNRAISKASDVGLKKRMGQAHKRVGIEVIRLAQATSTPRAVGKGAGATMRPSAARSRVQIRTGGKHRLTSKAGKRIPSQWVPARVWGKRRTVPIGTRVPRRPSIIGAALRNRRRIMALYLRAVRDAFAGMDFK